MIFQLPKYPRSVRTLSKPFLLAVRWKEDLNQMQIFVSLDPCPKTHFPWIMQIGTSLVHASWHNNKWKDVTSLSARDSLSGNFSNQPATNV